MDLNLPETLYTPEQLQETLINLGTYVGILRNDSAKVQTGVPVSDSEAAANLLEKLHDVLALINTDQPATLEQVEALVHSLEEVLQKAPVVHLTLPDFPGGALKKQITSWVRLNISPQALVSFHFNSSLGGGFMLRAGSRIYDFSFRSQLLAKRADLAKLFRNETA